MNFRRFTVFLLIKKKSLINYCAIYSRADVSTGWRGADKRGPPVSGTGRERGRALVHGPTRQRLKGGGTAGKRAPRLRLHEPMYRPGPASSRPGGHGKAAARACDRQRRRAAARAAGGGASGDDRKRRRAREEGGGARGKKKEGKEGEGDLTGGAAMAGGEKRGRRRRPVMPRCGRATATPREREERN
uniref:Uncharacterized protein n=1 Tax=Oryza sativa subsp. japonica TaxID=39947 RepID=Q8H4F3_ORYSJ|nr:hypothetical protein [Oryza sativa Japonica Group]